MHDDQEKYTPPSRVDTPVSIVKSQSSCTPIIHYSSSSTLQTPYTIYGKWQKRFIVLGAAIAALLSSVTTNIYLPVLPVLADHFNVTESKINLTITTYLVFQGVTPAILGGFTDRYGRRPTYMICLTISMLSNVGLAVSDRYVELLVIRCFQAIGVASLQALCQAVVADVITNAERGQYMALTQLAPILGPSLGALLGGTLAYLLGWRSVFMFLAISSLVILSLMLLFFPETCRRIAGDGSQPVSKVYQPLRHLIKVYRVSRTSDNHVPSDRDTDRVERQNGAAAAPILLTLSQALILFFRKELCLLTLYNGLIFGGIQAISTTIPSQFMEIYQLNTFRIGLLYLPVVGGGVIATLIIGKAMNWNFARYARKGDISALEHGRQHDLYDFPIERARIQVALPALVISIVSVAAWGWSLEKGTSIAVPCMLIFCVAFGLIGVNSAMTSLVADTHPGQAGSAAAANNIGRFGLAAIMTAAIQPLIHAVGIGLACTIISCLYILFSPLLFVVMFRGMRWRVALREKEEAREREKHGVGGANDPEQSTTG
ncbi:major facilitator superfamily domain-containing protein [Truncatella angustata]|uniref:Major facilitator superfamily domain-containing protein n=1 Tax=Truncatella angustata TaxID=152316 RepID=A0A9P8UEL7_9PEZI|nr:major facilitator superfamily domain-containing protein [Truncatella angustata]KAH6648540.1 major facilitator superfamily domain-containing protein [Truncatella angustata]